MQKRTLVGSKHILDKLEELGLEIDLNSGGHLDRWINLNISNFEYGYIHIDEVEEPLYFLNPDIFMTILGQTEADFKLKLFG